MFSWFRNKMVKTETVIKQVNNRDAHVEYCKQMFHDFTNDYNYSLRHVKSYDEINVNGQIIRYNIKPIGTIIVYYEGDQLKVGWSRLHEGDRYNRYIGIAKAINDSRNKKLRAIPRSFQKIIAKMVEFATSEKGQEVLK
jgi:hypothetical protein